MKKSYASTTYFFPNGKHTEKVILALPRGKMGCTWGGGGESSPEVGKKNIP